MKARMWNPSITGFMKNPNCSNCVELELFYFLTGINAKNREWIS
jgi:hypothetical protein